MADQGRKRRFRRKEPQELSEEELARAKGEALPDREAMSVIRSDVSIPLDPELAASVLAGDPDAPQEEAPEEPPGAPEDEPGEREEPRG